MDRKKLIKHMLFPHPVVVWILDIIASALLIYSTIALTSADILSIIAYALSFCALMLTVVRVPDMIAFIRRFKSTNRYALRFSTDIRWRMNTTLYAAFTFNAAYAALQLGLGLFHHSVWFYSMAAYHMLLALMRLVLVRYTRKHEPGHQQIIEWQKYRFCGGCIMLMTLALTVFMLYFIFRIREFRHHEITTITMALYTFTSLILAICNVLRYKSYGSPAWSAAKAVSLVSALVSVLTLENAMLTAFGHEGDGLFRQLMLGGTGFFVAIAVQGIAIYMIINATRHIRRAHSKEQIP